ncbi:tyrosine-type recombinase/integrase [Herminiimonas contaminans]|uniref:Site-specific integrase n=1 Tax=Herminiimonas contaminans TaxID=1111140 RepID=A0ABS0ESM8_9BURK|nr:site-specific integrase [Herminiimonas contaminans]MBF8177846.1 site-specific integrase [Herminiimonas contaminans]
MPIETITKSGRKRYRWTFNRIIEGSGRIRQTKLLPAGTTAAEADALGRKWESEIYAIATGTRKAVVTIGECVRKHVADVNAEWKDREKRVRILEKWRSEYDDQDATDLHEWSKSFVGYLRANKARSGLNKRPLTDGSIRNILAYIRAAIKYAYKVGLIEEDHTGRMTIPPVSNERTHYPQRKEMLRIARKCRDRQVRAAIRIAFYSGMRREEILIAKATKKGYVLDAKQTKNGKPRIVPIHRKIAVLARRIRFTIDGDRFSGEWERARALAGYPETRFHDLRHGAASEMLNSGVPLVVVGSVLGHLSMVSTKRYSHLLTDQLEEAVSKIGTRQK